VSCAARDAGARSRTAIKALQEACATVPSPHSQVEILCLGGAAGRVPSDATAFAHRDAAYILNVVAAWTDVEQTDNLVSWARTVYTSMDSVDAEPDRARSVYPGQTYTRLQQLKHRLDPRAVFTGNVPIALSP
jgi:hypothetical protein